MPKGLGSCLCYRVNANPPRGDDEVAFIKTALSEHEICTKRATQEQLSDDKGGCKLDRKIFYAMTYSCPF